MSNIILQKQGSEVVITKDSDLEFVDDGILLDGVFHRLSEYASCLLADCQWMFDDGLSGCFYIED